jgi:hypothetical protein
MSFEAKCHLMMYMTEILRTSEILETENRELPSKFLQGKYKQYDNNRQQYKQYKQLRLDLIYCFNVLFCIVCILFVLFLVLFVVCIVINYCFCFYESLLRIVRIVLHYLYHY